MSSPPRDTDRSAMLVAERDPAAGDAPQHGIDAGKIGRIGPWLDAWEEAHVHAVLVVRHGVTVYERYFAGADEHWDGTDLGRVVYHKARRHDLRSITKSVVSLLVGIARDQGVIGDLNSPVFAFFPEHADLWTPDKDAITVRHLLTMSAGLEWNEEVPPDHPDNSDDCMTLSPDPCRYVLQQRLTTTPGRTFNYSGGATTLLAEILKRTTGCAIDRLAADCLLGPLGIDDLEWERFANGDPIAASGLKLRPRDLAKLGRLVLSGGVWNGRQIVSAAWLTQSMQAQISAQGRFQYGYHWWIGRSSARGRIVEWVAAFGYGGQRLYVIPACGLAVVVMCGLYNDPALERSIGAILLERYVLPAVDAG